VTINKCYEFDVFNYDFKQNEIILAAHQKELWGQPEGYGPPFKKHCNTALNSLAFTFVKYRCSLFKIVLDEILATLKESLITRKKSLFPLLESVKSWNFHPQILNLSLITFSPQNSTKGTNHRRT